MSKADLRLDWASHEAAKYACERWHYSKSMPIGKLVKVGVWEHGQFVGVVIFSRGANKTLTTPWGLKQTEACELTRVALRSHSAEVSRMLRIALKFLPKVAPGMRLVISFADPEQEHYGGIYQAAGWIYTGMSSPQEEYMYKGKRWHGRAFRKSFGSHTKYLGRGLRIVTGSSKHRYLAPLDEAMRKQIEAFAKPYPKRPKLGDGPSQATAARQQRPGRSNEAA